MWITLIILKLPFIHNGRQLHSPRFVRETRKKVGKIRCQTPYMSYMQKRIKWYFNYSQDVEWKNGIFMLSSLSIRTLSNCLGELV